MPDKFLYVKIAFSAITGLFIASALVYVPGTMFMRPSCRQGPHQEIWRIHMEMLVDGRLSDNRVNDKAKELMERTHRLLILQNEISCWPFLLTASSVGPLLLLRRRKVVSMKFGQENMRATLLTLWWGEG